MPPLILKQGYEEIVRSKLGVKSSEVTDAEINQRMIIDLAEATVIRRVADPVLQKTYTDITEPTDLMYLESAVICYMCKLLCPGLARRLNSSVSTIDVTWKKDKINWDDRALSFAAEYENALFNIKGYSVATGSDSPIIRVAKGPSTTATTG